MRTSQQAIEALVLQLARRRTHGQVYMGGESDPTPGEVQLAKFFILDLIAAGWVPPISTNSRQLLGWDV